MYTFHRTGAIEVEHKKEINKDTTSVQESNVRGLMSDWPKLLQLY